MHDYGREGRIVTYEVAAQTSLQFCCKSVHNSAWQIGQKKPLTASAQSKPSANGKMLVFLKIRRFADS